MTNKEFSLLVYHSESGDRYHFLFKTPLKFGEEFLTEQLPWECDEDGILLGSWFWEHLELEDGTEE